VGISSALVSLRISTSSRYMIDITRSDLFGKVGGISSALTSSVFFDVLGQ